MPLPSSVKVGLLTYEIVQTEDSDQHLRDADLAGRCDVENLKIYVSTTMSPIVQAETLCHEILHAAFRATGLPETEIGPHEEIIVLSLSHVLWPLVAGAHV